MMVKVFTLNKNGKIELTKEELQKLLDDSYWEGYRANHSNYYTYTTPSINPWTITCNSASDKITLTSQDVNTINANL